MKHVKPEVALIARPMIDYDAVSEYLTEQQVSDRSAWYRDHPSDAEGEDLVEFAGRLCYKSWEPRLNPNVTKIRNDREAYLKNILASRHGSVLEHANYTFVFHNVSRVLTAELNRHRAGVAISEQSMRYVRLDEIPFWFPEWAKQDQKLMDACISELIRAEEFQRWMASHFGLDEPGVNFHEKKHKTSFMRRFAPMGVATEEVWTANVRTLRHVIEKRTDPSAEEEIRLVFSAVAEIMKKELPFLFGDYDDDYETGYTTDWPKV